MKTDQATTKIERLQYARVQVEVEVDQEFLEKVCFMNERGMMVDVQVGYEWKPMVYSRCKNLGIL